MGYRPITDVWILGRPKVKYYGAYPAGFLERARELLVGGDPDAVIAHLPGGHAHEYNGVHGGITLTGFGRNDYTVDIDPECNPDVVYDLRDLDMVMFREIDGADVLIWSQPSGISVNTPRPDAILIDLPYSPDDADHYAMGRAVLPRLNATLRACLSLIRPNGRVGVIDTTWPFAGPSGRETAAIAVSCGRNARVRIFTVWKPRSGK